jgi:hypothetical protein
MAINCTKSFEAISKNSMKGADTTFKMTLPRPVMIGLALRQGVLGTMSALSAPEAQDSSDDLQHAVQSSQLTILVSPEVTPLVKGFKYRLLEAWPFVS